MIWLWVDVIYALLLLRLSHFLPFLKENRIIGKGRIDSELKSAKNNENKASKLIIIIIQGSSWNLHRYFLFEDKIIWQYAEK